ncbi:MAG: dihydropteroate synthase [Bacteroidales bacterium]|nr:dihydropteroate synthase [Bacteroidales bacterium]
MKGPYGEVKILGIVNLSPDSFFAGSIARGEDDAIARIEDWFARGAWMVDLGPASTKPGAPDVSPEEQWRRLEPVLKRLPAGLYSIDTTSAEVVRKACDLIGPFTVNDISAGEDDPAMLPLVAELGLPFIAMHKRGNPRTMDSLVEYPQGIVKAVEEYFEDFARKAEALGIRDWILDPGFGFAKTEEQNWELLRSLAVFRRFGKPVLAGVADKRFTRGDTPAAEALAVAGGADILRCH